MATKSIKKNVVDELFNEAQVEINERVKKEAKVKIKDLLSQRINAVKLVTNIDRQIESLKLKIGQELS